MSSIDLSGRKDEDPPGIPRTGLPGPPTPSSSSFSPEIERLGNGNLNQEHPEIVPTGSITHNSNTGIVTHKSESGRKNTGNDTQISNTGIGTHKSEREKSPGIVHEIMNIFGFGKSKNRSDISINSPSDQDMEEKYAAILKIDSQNSINRNSEKMDKSPESGVVEHDLIQTTPKRSVPAISFDQFREEDSLHARRRSGEFSYTTDIPAPKKPQNPRILILDFKETSASNVQLVRRALITYTEIRNFSIKVLVKGGISILFAKPKARDFAAKVLTEKLAPHLATRRGFLKNKKVFEVITTVAKTMNLDEIRFALGAISFKSLGHNRVIFTLGSPEEASRLISEGFFYESIHYEFQPFVFRPKIACKCGSLFHMSCNAIESKDNDSETPVPCANCQKTDHSSKECVLYKNRLQTAFANKKKTYAEALKVQPSQPKAHYHLSMKETSKDTFEYSSLVLDIVKLVLGHFKIELDFSELTHVVDLAITSLQSGQVKPSGMNESSSSSQLSEPKQSKASQPRNAKNSSTKSNLAPKKPLSKYSVYNQPVNGSQQESVLEKMVVSYESSSRSIPTSNVMDTEEKTTQTDTVMEEKNYSSDNDENESVISTNSRSGDESRDSSPTNRGFSNRGRGRGRGGRGGHVSSRQETAMEKPKPKPKAKPDYSNFPRCGCGHVYKQVASWQSHWNPKKSKPCPRQEVRCHCGFYTLTSMNYSGLVSKFNAHLNSSICKKP
jgi:hypothetical protein